LPGGGGVVVREGVGGKIFVRPGRRRHGDLAAGALNAPGVQVGQVLSVPFPSAQIERYLHKVALLKGVQRAAAILYGLKLDQLRIIAVRDFQHKFTCLETGRLLLGWKNAVEFTLYFESHKRKNKCAMHKDTVK
jgi:hypothetical protein